jgi:uncharacterized protein YxjI
MPSYTVTRRLISVGRDYEVKNEVDEVVLKIDGKVRFGRTFAVKDRDGKLLLRVREKLLCLDRTFIIKRGSEVVATVRRTTTSDETPAKFTVDTGGAQMKAKGSFFHDSVVELSRDGFTAGSVSRKQYTAVRDTYYVSAASSEDQPLMVAIAMSIAEVVPFHGAEDS